MIGPYLIFNHLILKIHVFYTFIFTRLSTFFPTVISRDCLPGIKTIPRCVYDEKDGLYGVMCTCNSHYCNVTSGRRSSVFVLVSGLALLAAVWRRLCVVNDWNSMEGSFLLWILFFCQMFVRYVPLRDQKVSQPSQPCAWRITLHWCWCKMTFHRRRSDIDSA